MWRHASNDEENVNASSLRENRLSANCFKNWVIWKTSGEGFISLICIHFAYATWLTTKALMMMCVECSSSPPEMEKDPVALGTRELPFAKEAAPQWYLAARRADFMFDKWSGFLIIHCYYYYYFLPQINCLNFHSESSELLS